MIKLCRCVVLCISLLCDTGGRGVHVCVCVFVCIPLGDVEHMLRRGFVQSPAVNRPQAAEDPEQGALPAAVGPCDQ